MPTLTSRRLFLSTAVLAAAVTVTAAFARQYSPIEQAPAPTTVSLAVGPPRSAMLLIQPIAKPTPASVVTSTLAKQKRWLMPCKRWAYR